MPADELLAAQRIAALYRRLVLLGKARVPLAAGRRLVGPDCAYHLYFRSTPDRAGGRRRGRRRRRRLTPATRRG